VVSVLAFQLTIGVGIPIYVSIFIMERLLETNENKQKRSRDGRFHENNEHHFNVAYQGTYEVVVIHDSIKYTISTTELVSTAVAH